ncbi:uncharacterized protein LOC119388887 [Rhipicephalus sanguineus]|uniref:uncharacterized protein LOC119388887 n=1 Tax=Rhipicephalus sanguineus TaxID=34632 RepID=UPI001893E81C|nr:uncharacterized protein LOC119388887 [Rhipicephalus sanguineus]
MMATVMDALASVVRNSSELRGVNGLGPALKYRESAEETTYKGATHVNYSSFLDHLDSPFLRLWLTESRLFNVQPPLVQAALAAVGGVGWGYSATEFFETPYYYDNGPAAYNYATLGQSADSPTFERMDDTTLEGDALEHVMGTQLAYLALERVPFVKNRVLAATKFSPKALFSLFHCYFSCALGRPIYSIDDRCMVLLRNWATFTTSLPCGINITRKTFDACRYIW